MSLNLYEYHEYRKYLNDFYIDKKKNTKNFSYQSFNERAGLSSPSHYKMVVNAQRSLSNESIDKFNKGLGHNQKEGKYFKNLVFFSQAKNLDQKRGYFKELDKIRSLQKETLGQSKQSCLYNDWYGPLLYELIQLDGFVEDYDVISKLLEGKVKAKEIKKTLEGFLKYELVYRKNGKLMVSQITSKSTDEVEDFLIRSFQKKMYQLSEKAFEQKLKDREINCLTIAINKEELPNMKQKIKAFISELNTEFSTGENKTDIYQLNLQLFNIIENV